MTIARQIQQHGSSIWNKPSIIFSVLLVIGVFMQYNEYLNIQKRLDTLGDGNGGRSRQKRSATPDYYDADIDDDLEMASTAVYESFSEPQPSKTPSKLVFEATLLNESQIDADCVSPAVIDWHTPMEPKYQLDPNRFLIPALIWGPMNQVEGLRESIAIAISLNRTLVLPPMYRHFTDPDGPNEVVDSKIRVDIPSIRQLLSVVSMDSLESSFKPDGVLYARTIGFGLTTGVDMRVEKTLTPSNSRLGRLRKFQDATGYSVLLENIESPTETQDFFSVAVSPPHVDFDTDLRLSANKKTNWTQVFQDGNQKYQGVCMTFFCPRYLDVFNLDHTPPKNNFVSTLVCL
jgi:hypothetical protein